MTHLEDDIEEDEVDSQVVEDLDILVVVLVDDLQEDRDISEVEQVVHEIHLVRLHEIQVEALMVGKNNNLAFLGRFIILQD